MSEGNGQDSAGFNANYKVLKETADWLSQQEEPDIDQLVPRVEKAMRAYQLCKERLSKVQATLGQYLQAETAPADASADGDGRARGKGRRPPVANGGLDGTP